MCVGGCDAWCGAELWLAQPPRHRHGSGGRGAASGLPARGVCGLGGWVGECVWVWRLERCVAVGVVAERLDNVPRLARGSAAYGDLRVDEYVSVCLSVCMSGPPVLIDPA